MTYVAGQPATKKGKIVDKLSFSNMFGLSVSEIFVIAVVILLVVGPDKLPEFMQVLGRNLWKIRHATDEIKSNLNLPSLDSIKEEILKDDEKK